MALISCPDCGRSTSDAARVCAHCGRLIRDRVMTATAPPAQSYSAAVDTNAEAVSVSLPYFEVALGKFVVMSLVTFGLYELYWMYQQWKRLKTRTMNARFGAANIAGVIFGGIVLLLAVVGSFST